MNVDLLKIFKDRVDELYKLIGEETGKDVAALIRCDISLVPVNSSSEQDNLESIVYSSDEVTPPLNEGKKKSDRKYTVVIDGKEKSYVYEMSMWRNKFMSIQRPHYKNRCHELQMEFIPVMYTSMINYYWKKMRKSNGEFLSQSEDEINLIDFYKSLKKSEQDDMFIKNPHYHSLIK